MNDYYAHNEAEYKDYLKKYPPYQDQNAHMIPFLMKKLKDLEFDRVFECGIGYGLVMREIIREFHPTMRTGIDLSKDQVEEAEIYLRGLSVHTVHGDIIEYESSRTYPSFSKRALKSCNHWSSGLLSSVMVSFVGSIRTTCLLDSRHMLATALPTYSGGMWLTTVEAITRSWFLADVEAIPKTVLQYMRFEEGK